MKHYLKPCFLHMLQWIYIWIVMNKIIIDLVQSPISVLCQNDNCIGLWKKSAWRVEKLWLPALLAHQFSDLTLISTLWNTFLTCIPKGPDSSFSGIQTFLFLSWISLRSWIQEEVDILFEGWEGIMISMVSLISQTGLRCQNTDNDALD